VGETSQLLRLRVSQHKNDIKNKKDSTALADPALETGHPFSFDNTTIISREENRKKESRRASFPSFSVSLLKFTASVVYESRKAVYNFSLFRKN
jgi:hypothetical protein